LLLNDSARNIEYKKFAEVFVKRSLSQNKEKASFILATELKDIAAYKHVTQK